MLLLGYLKMDSGTWEDFEVFCFSINMLIALLGQ